VGCAGGWARRSLSCLSLSPLFFHCPRCRTFGCGRDFHYHWSHFLMICEVSQLRAREVSIFLYACILARECILVLPSQHHGRTCKAKRCRALFGRFPLTLIAAIPGYYFNEEKNRYFKIDSQYLASKKQEAAGRSAAVAAKVRTANLKFSPGGSGNSGLSALVLRCCLSCARGSLLLSVVGNYGTSCLSLVLIARQGGSRTSNCHNST
jgi:hypothetical protein